MERVTLVVSRDDAVDNFFLSSLHKTCDGRWLIVRMNSTARIVDHLSDDVHIHSTQLEANSYQQNSLSWHFSSTFSVRVQSIVLNASNAYDENFVKTNASGEDVQLFHP